MFSLKTELAGLELCLAEPRHAPSLFALVDANRSYLRQWLPWLDANTTVADSENFLQGCQQAFARQEQLNTLLFFRGELVGTAGFNSFDPANHTGEIGYWLSESHSGHGFMTSAVRALLRLGFEERGLNRTVIRAATGNYPSRGIPERLNFCHEGTAREAGQHYGEYLDLEIYSLLRREWLQQSNV